uniref:APC membrane recruitment protein 2 n=1 Tax=Anolis carolinensis TaxID=28377 RepID=G1KBR9_ANOCA|nr:PREDICTED: APC membrane recruitment protein 2 [Anolis carolinensis]|eukprot:XP_008106216.1 PREDICTED: APC membrane recruitment protein 2 [Anolis carolinensis]
MDDGAPEPTTVGEQQPPSGKLNKTAFKLFKRRKSGGAMPSIFGVRSSKGKGDGGGAGGERAAVASPVPAPAGGLVRSKTHDGLAEVGLEGAVKKEKEAEEAEAPASPPSSSPSSSAAVGKSHSFFSLLRKNGGGAKGERPKGRGGGGLKGLFNSMRWSRRETHKPVGGKGEGGDGPGLMPGSLTASLECIKEEAPPPPKQPLPPSSGEGSPKASPSLLLDSDGDKAPELDDTWELMPALLSPLGEDLPGMLAQVKKGSGLESPPPLSGQQEKPQEEEEEEEEKAASAAITGCGDIIADHEGDAGGGGGVSGGGGGSSSSEKSVPGASKKPVSVGGVLTYQGGGEEMASPEQVGDTCAPEFWDVLSQTSRGKESPKASKEVNGAKGVQDGSASGQHVGFNHSHKEDQKSRDKEQQEAIPSGDEGYWDSTTPGPEEDTTNNIQKEVIPRDSYSGDALYDLYTEPEENTATTTSAEDVATGTCGKPLSPVTTTCPVKTHTTSLKDSKIPISIKHFTSPHSSHGPDTSNSHHIAHHHPTKSEIPRTKIPVSKVLVQRAGYRSLAGTTGKAATYHESAKK